MPLEIIPPRKVSASPDGSNVVTSLNGLDGDLTLASGDGLALDVAGSVLTLSITSGFFANQLTEGPGIDLSGAGPVNIRAKRACLLIFMDGGFTPSTNGADANVQVVPYSPTDGVTVLTYNVRQLFWRVENASSGESRIYPELYAGGGQFSGTNMFSGLSPAYLSMTGSSVYERKTNTFATGSRTVQSGNKIRIQIPILDSGHTGWYVALLLEEQ